MLRNVGTSADITPNIGTVFGGTTVTLTGTHFSQATQVKFDSTVATDLTVISENTISVVTPAHAAGVVDIHVISDSGDQALVGAFTYFEPVSTVVDSEEEVLLLFEPVSTVIGLGTLPKTGATLHMWLPFVIALLGLLLAAISENRRRKIA